MAPLLLANKYLLLKRLASGGMAEIYLAKQVGLDGFEKLVVVKRILPALASQKQYVRMFLDEARTAADLRHPNIVSTFEIAEDNGVYFMVMEYLHGLDLRFIFRTLSSKDESIPLALAVGVVMEACAGLSYAHKKNDLKGRSLGIVHRDISPQNLVVTFDGETKVVDFGIAQADNLQDEAKHGLLKGKFAYMSPQQASGQNLDHTTDQFSLAIVLYELTTMHRLFKRNHHEESLAAVSQCDIQRPSKLIPAYPLALEAIVMKALAKRPNDRYADCGEFRAALDGFLQSAGLVFSRDKLASYLNERFKEQHDPRVDLSATYLLRQTQSESAGSLHLSSKKRRQRVALLSACVGLLAAVTVGMASMFVMKDENKPPIVDVLVKNEVTEWPVEMEQSLGIPESPIAAKKNKPAEKKSLGRLKIVVEPWGEIFVDGKRIGLTPLAPQKILEGSHSIRIVNTRLAKEKTLRVVIRANQDTLVRHEF